MVDSFPFPASLQTMLSYCVLASIFLEKSAVDLIGISLYVMNHFSLAVFKIFSLPLTLNIFTMMCVGVNLFAFILLGVH